MVDKLYKLCHLESPPSPRPPSQKKKKARSPVPRMKEFKSAKSDRYTLQVISYRKFQILLRVFLEPIPVQHASYTYYLQSHSLDLLKNETRKSLLLPSGEGERPLGIHEQWECCTVIGVANKPRSLFNLK